jgi:hypothetical protein
MLSTLAGSIGPGPRRHRSLANEIPGWEIALRQLEFDVK